MESLEVLILRIKQEPAANREIYLQQWEEFLASFAVLHLTPHIYNAKTLQLLNFITQTLPFYTPQRNVFIDVANVPKGDSTRNVENGTSEALHTIKKAPTGMVDSPELGKDLFMMLIDFIKQNRKRVNGKMLRQIISTTFLLRSKRLVDIYTVLPQWLSLLDLEDSNVRKRLFVYIVRDLTIVFQKVKDEKVYRMIQKLFFTRLRDRFHNVQLMSCCICVEMYKRGIWRDSYTINEIAACTAAPNLKLVLAATHFLLGTKNHFDVAYEALENPEEEIANLEMLSKQNAHLGVHSKKSEGRQNRIARSKKKLEKQLKRSKRRMELTAVHEFAAIDEIRNPQNFTEELFERARRKDVTFNPKLTLLHLVSVIIARHRLLLPNFYSYILKYINHKQRLVTKVLAIAAQSVHSEIPGDIVDPVIKQVLDQFVSEDRSNEVITVGINTIREIASRSPYLLKGETISQINDFRNVKSKPVSMATKSFINLYREEAPELLHPTLRGREAGTKLCNAKKGVKLTASSTLSSTRILTQEDFAHNRLLALQKVPSKARTINVSEANLSEDDEDNEDYGDDSEVDGEDDGSEDEDEGDLDRLAEGFASDDSEEEYDAEVEDEEGDSGDDLDTDADVAIANSDDESEEDGEMEKLIVNPDDLAFGSKKKRTAAHSRQEAAMARQERKRQRLVAESKAGRKQSTTNRVKARNKPVLMTMHSRRVKGKQNQNVAEKYATLKQHLKSLKKGNTKYKKRRH
ncbi:hsda/sda1-related protein [Babesia gibsoni]|uniref:Protein SDA1 n=1 Tax=Babesia gibsoni TaxID=33632 RepID=A0AAD8LRB1_BABGI|nr:hsda/sda1-related protein [Babesia gibsoni]